MRVSQRLDYAVRALVLLAMQPAGQHIAAGDLANQLGLPRRFVEQQITTLSRAGIVRCRRGARGGCVLSRPAEQISVRDVVEALEGGVLDVPRHVGSGVAEMWLSAAESLGSELGSVDLAMVAARQRELDAESAPIYYI